MDIRKFFSPTTGGKKLSKNDRQKAEQSSPKLKKHLKTRDVRKQKHLSHCDNNNEKVSRNKEIKATKLLGSTLEFKVQDNQKVDVMDSKETKKTSRKKVDETDQTETAEISVNSSSAKKLKGKSKQKKVSSKKKCKKSEENFTHVIEQQSKKKESEICSDEFEEEEFLKTKRKKRKRSKAILDSDSDEEDPIPLKVKEKIKSKSKKRKTSDIYIDDSDEEPVSPIKNYFKSQQHKQNKSPTKLDKSPEPLQQISVADFFGAGLVKRSGRKTVAMKRKMEDDNEVNMELHDDDSFSETLKQLDTERTVRVEETPEKSEFNEKSLQKINGENVSGENSLSGKISTKMKLEKYSAIKPTKRKSDSVAEKETSTPTKKQKLSTSKDVLIDVEMSSSTPRIPLSQTREAQNSNWVSDSTPSTSRLTKTSTERRNIYQSFLQREGPRALGSKEIPQGQENCLEGLTFVITGVLESIERDEAKSLVERYGGKVTQSISKRTSYIVVGRDAGVLKLKKSKQYETKQLDEDGLFELICTQPGKKSKYEIKAAESMKKGNAAATRKKWTKSAEKVIEAPSSLKTCEVSQVSSLEREPRSSEVNSSMLWVDKYKPKTMQQIIGQQGDKSNAKKLYQWIVCWHDNRAEKVKPSGKFFVKDNGSGYKAALLSGPPGVGKTTTAQLVCQEASFSYIELNASDTRSKRCLHQEVNELLKNQTIVDMCGSGKLSCASQNHCLIMDEVDGMAGNEDRGGIQELLQLIKNTKIPIICLCNDRNHPKIRSLSNYCFDLRFQKPRLEQIKAAMMSIAFKENLRLSPPSLNEVILAANQDIRQVIHNLSVWSAGEKALTYEQARDNANKAKKDLKLGPFDICRSVFVADETTRKMTLMDKLDLFFHDYNIASLFVHENYPHVYPYSSKGDMKIQLSLLARTADSICDGDLVDKLIRKDGNWGLLPVQGMYASVLPGEYMRGSLPQMVTFPRWLGKNSSQNKVERILQELKSHMMLKITGDKKGLCLDYLPSLNKLLTKPLIDKKVNGVLEVIKMMDAYDLIKEDYDNIMEISKWPNSKDPMSMLTAKTKAAFTRAYNKSAHLVSYFPNIVPKKKKGKAAAITPSLDSDDNFELNSDSGGDSDN